MALAATRRAYSSRRRDTAAHLVERLPRDDSDEVYAQRVTYLRLIDVGPPQSGLLRRTSSALAAEPSIS